MVFWVVVTHSIYAVCHCFRTPDKYCRQTYILPRILSSSTFFFFCRLIFELAERNSPKIGHMLGSNCDLKTHVQNLGILSPTNQGPKTTFLGRLRNLTAKLTAYILGTKRDIDNRSSALTTTRNLLHLLRKCPELWSTNGFKLDRHFYPPYVNSVFYVIGRLRRHRSANGTQPNFGKRQTVNHTNNLL